MLTIAFFLYSKCLAGWIEDAEEGTCQEARVFFCDPASRVEAMQQRHQIQRDADGIRFPAKVYVKYCDSEV